MGTGLNSQIIGASTAWKFEFTSGIILLALTLPLNWQLTRYLGAIGPAISNLISFAVYNFIRYMFLWNKYRMQPFTIKTALALLLGAASYFIAWLLFREQHGFVWMLLRSIVFCILFAVGMITMKLSPDVQPVFNTIKKRLGFQV
jgi:O-antigen/teichoic acid export membrane protein